AAMVAKIRSDGYKAGSAAGKIHQAVPKLRDQLQSRGRHGAPLHRQTHSRRFRQTVERIRQTALLAALAQRVNRSEVKVMKVDRLVPKPMTRAHSNALGTARSTLWSLLGRRVRCDE